MNLGDVMQLEQISMATSTTGDTPSHANVSSGVKRPSGTKSLLVSPTGETLTRARVKANDKDEDDDDKANRRKRRGRDPDTRRGSNKVRHKPNVAWDESEFSTSLYDVQQAMQIDSSGIVQGPQKKRSMRRRIVNALGIAVCLVQCAWSILIPLKNVFMIQYPMIPADSVTMQFTASYEPGPPNDQPLLQSKREGIFRNDPLAKEATAFSGINLPRLLDRVASIVIANSDVRQELEKMQRFEIDSIFKFLSFDEMEVMLQYYALVMQSSEFPAGRFTVRQFSNTTSSLSSSSTPASTSLTIIMQDSLSQQNLSLELACFEPNSALVGTRCIDSVSQKPCVLATADGSHQTFQDTLLNSLESNSSLDNNIGLLYMVEFFHTTMSNLFETRDWSQTLEAVGFLSTQLDAIERGTLSAFTKGSTPILSITDAFLLGIEVGSLENWKLESCFASELVTAHFFTRSLVLHVVHNALARQQFPYHSIKPDVPISRKAAMTALAPMLENEVQFTSGVALAMRRDHNLWYFKRNNAMSSQRFLEAQAKLDRRFNIFEQPLSSSMRMIQFMAFYPDLVSVMTRNTNLQLSVDPASGESVYYDTQHHKLLGAFGAVEGVVGFDNDQQEAKNSRFALVLKELPSNSPDAISFNALFAQEEQLAKWFAEQEENALVQAVFDPFLAISPIRGEFTTTAAAPTNGTALACHRSLLKVLSKVTFLTLMRVNPAVWYFLFASDASIGNENWLVSQIFKEEIVVDAPTGDKVAFVYRNQAAKQSALSVADGSSWVVLPLIRLLLSSYGNKAALALLSAELDRSFELFAKKTGQGLFNFPDLSRCKVAAKDPFVEVTSGDTMAQAYAKIKPSLQSSMAALVSKVPALVNTMESKRTSHTENLLADQLHLLLVSNPDLAKDKVPLGWYPTEATIGLWKLWPATTPTATAMSSVRNAIHCFSTLDLRTLTTTPRCFAEKSGVQVQVESFEASILRDFLLTNWSMGVMLNTLVAAVILKYLKKFVRAWQITRLRGLTIQLALQLNLQGLSVLTKSQSALMMIAGLPLLLNLHFPFDQVIVPMESQFSSTSNSVDLNGLKPPYTKALSALLVTLSMTWLLKAGFDFANAFFRPNRPIDWLRLFHIRLVLVMFIFVVLVLVGDAKQDGNMRFVKLLLTCAGSFVLGLVVITGVVFLPERKLQVQIDIGQTDQKQSDVVLTALVRQKMPLNKYGVLGRTSRGYSQEGLIMEGWRVAKTQDGKLVLRRDGGEIPMPKSTDDEDDNVHPKEHPPEHTSAVIPVPTPVAPTSPRPQEL